MVERVRHGCYSVSTSSYLAVGLYVALTRLHLINFYLFSSRKISIARAVEHVVIALVSCVIEQRRK